MAGACPGEEGRRGLAGLVVASPGAAAPSCLAGGACRVPLQAAASGGFFPWAGASPGALGTAGGWGLQGTLAGASCPAEEGRQRTWGVEALDLASSPCLAGAQAVLACQGEGAHPGAGRRAGVGLGVRLLAEGRPRAEQPLARRGGGAS